MDGKLLCIGSQVEIKRRHSERYQLVVNLRKDCVGPGRGGGDRVSDWITGEFPEVKIRKNLTIGLSKNLTIDLPSWRLAGFCERFDEEGGRLGVGSWGLAQSTLRDIFLDFAGNK